MVSDGWPIANDDLSEWRAVAAGQRQASTLLFVCIVGVLHRGIKLRVARWSKMSHSCLKKAQWLVLHQLAMDNA